MLKIPKIVIGCMSWGKWGKELTTEQQADLISFCIQQGNSTFDHADIYGDYSMESEFGIAFKESGISREQIQIITKCGIQLTGGSRSNRVKHYDYSKEYIIGSAERSLKNLKTDYLDVFLLHRPSPLMHPDEIAEAITHLLESRKIRHFGVSNFTPSQMDLVNRSIQVSANQIEFSLTQHSAMDDGTLDYLMSNDMKAMSWSPLGSVFKQKNDQTERIKSTLNELSIKYDQSANTILLNWILKHPANISPVIGTTSKERIAQSNAATTFEMELEDWFSLLRASQGKNVP
jgi:predicted oxidoreductase